MRQLLIFLIQCYRTLLSPFLGRNCRFHPTCSEYAITAIEHHGVVKGAILAITRISKCHPWHEGGFDPVPQTQHKHQ